MTYRTFLIVVLLTQCGVIAARAVAAQGAPPASKVSPAPVPAAPGLPYQLLSALRDTRIKLELENATPKEALRQIFEQAKLKADIAPDVPDEPRLTVKAPNIRFMTALELIVQAADLRVLLEADGVVRVRKGARGFQAFPIPGSPNLEYKVDPGLLERVNRFYDLDFGAAGAPVRGSIAVPFNAASAVARLWVEEERSTFTCPHCKGQSTVLRKRQQPKCLKCTRTFEGNWKFCPNDGTKRPETPADWKFCPHCGKEVRTEKSDLGVPVQKLPPVGIRY